MFCSGRESNLDRMAGSHLLGFEQRLYPLGYRGQKQGPDLRGLIGNSVYLIGLTLPKFINTN